MNKNVLIMGFLIMMVGGCAGTTAKNDKKEGDRAYYEGKYEEALSYYQKALTYDPKDTELRRIKATILSIQKKYPERTALFQELIQEDTNDIQSRLGLAYIYFLSNYTKAEKEYLEILKIDNENYAAREQLGWIYYYGKKYIKAKEYFSGLQNDYPRSVSPQLALGWIAMAELKWKEAYEQFTTLQENFPENIEAKKALEVIHKNYKP